MSKNVLILVLYVGLVATVIKMTPGSSALLHDANTYYQLALSARLSTFIDPGYSTALSILMRVVGSNNILALQMSNYLFWVISSYLVYLSLKRVSPKSARFTGLLMLFSPLFLSFSAKLYSEPFAALGVSLLIFGLTSRASLGIFLGFIILGATKSIFIPGFILLALYYLVRRESKKLLPILVGLIILIPVFLSSFGGGRSLYNLAVERAKLDQSYDQILACIPYYLSYPLGQKVLPHYLGVCHQNDPNPDMPGYEHNPYVKAEEIRQRGFTYSDWWQSVIKYPVKYVLVFVIGLFNLVLFEGVYPSILLQMPGWMIPILFILAKLVLVTYLWLGVIRAGMMNWKYLVPLIYLVVVIGNFQVEPRYIYPLIPYIYFLSGLDHNKKKL
jgi:hypothetical protein